MTTNPVSFSLKPVFSLKWLYIALWLLPIQNLITNDSDMVLASGIYQFEAFGELFQNPAIFIF